MRFVCQAVFLAILWSAKLAFLRSASQRSSLATVASSPCSTRYRATAVGVGVVVIVVVVVSCCTLLLTMFCQMFAAFRCANEVCRFDSLSNVVSCSRVVATVTVTCDLDGLVAAVRSVCGKKTTLHRVEFEQVRIMCVAVVMVFAFLS